MNPLFAPAQSAGSVPRIELFFPDPLGWLIGYALSTVLTVPNRCETRVSVLGDNLGRNPALSDSRMLPRDQPALLIRVHGRLGYELSCFVVGANGGGRTHMAVNRWNLNPVRLPVPPRSPAWL